MRTRHYRGLIIPHKLLSKVLYLKLFPNIQSEWDVIRLIARTVDEGIKVKSSSVDDVYTYYLGNPKEDFRVVVHMFGPRVKNVRRAQKEKQ